jgi:RimJ/RimL family protein N-acetyltransferase
MLGSSHFTPDVPILETERLKLRGHRLGDFSPSAATWGDSEVARYIGGKPLTEEESWTKLLRYVGHWSLLDFGYWVVEERATGDFVGEIGFADYKRDLVPSLKDVPEIGWVLAWHKHGRGFATEAIPAAVVWGDVHFAPPKTACIIDPANLPPSIRVAEKCGYREFQLTTYKGHPTMMFLRELNPSL